MSRNGTKCPSHSTKDENQKKQQKGKTERLLMFRLMEGGTSRIMKSHVRL